MTLQLRDVGKHYGSTPVFTHVNLNVAPGEFVAIVGESGVGKSTLLNCMAGLDRWDQGTVHLAGQALVTQCRQHGSALVLVTHSMAATEHADRVLHQHHDGIRHPHG